MSPRQLDHGHGHATSLPQAHTETEMPLHEPKIFPLFTQGRELTALEMRRIAESRCRTCGSPNGSEHHEKCTLAISCREMIAGINSRAAAMAATTPQGGWMSDDRGD